MKKFLLFTFLCVIGLAAAAAIKIPFTEVPYNVNYHWGIIDVNIAHGFVKYQCDGTNFSGTLDGVSIPWEGHVILVSDTLKTRMLPGNPYSKEQVTYQAGWYRRPQAKYYRSNTYDASNPANYKNIAGQGQYDASNNSMEAIAITSDMIAMFYYAKEFNFNQMHPNQVIDMPISGGYSNQVKVTYLGTGSYEINNTPYPTYNIQYEYAYKGQLSGYQVQMRIRQSDRLPIFISASLPVGRVEMIYNP